MVGTEMGLSNWNIYFDHKPPQDCVLIASRRCSVPSTLALIVIAHPISKSEMSLPL